MRRRFLERLQQAVEGLPREHVNLVDDIDLVTRRDRQVAHAVDDLADVVDTGARCGIHFHHVDMARFHDRIAMDAGSVHVDGRCGDAGLFVVEGAGQDAGGRGLADTAHAGQHEGMGDAAGVESIGQRADHRFLTDQILEHGRAIFAGQHLIAGGLGAGRGGRCIAEIETGLGGRVRAMHLVRIVGGGREIFHVVIHGTRALPSKGLR